MNMLQEASRLLNSAFQQSFIKNLCLYLHDCVREEVKSSTFRNLNQDKDNKWMFVEGEERLLSKFDRPLMLDGKDNQLTQLMIHSEISQKDHYLIYGYMFLTGNSSGRKQNEFLTPLLYLPCKLERNGMNIELTATEENLSLNTGALAGLIKCDDEDEIEHLFEGLIDVVPDLPLTAQKVQIFLTTLKALVPDVEIRMSMMYEKSANPSGTGVCLEEQSAIILTKRPSITAGVLHELTQMSEKPSGLFRETSLSIINEEYTKSSSNKINNRIQEVLPITPLEISDCQSDVIQAIQNNPLVTVFGPPGTGKSQTIVNLVSHLVASGKTVLVASRMDKAVDVVADRLNNLGAPYLTLRAGRANYQKQLNFDLQDLLSNKVDIDTGFETSILTSHDDIVMNAKTVSDLEDKCEKIIKLEENWVEKFDAYKKKSIEIEDNIISLDHINLESIIHASKLVDNIENRWQKSSFFNNIFLYIDNFKLNKSLKLSQPLNEENIYIIRQNIELKKINLEIKKIEGAIRKTGNIHQIIINLRELRQKQKSIAIELLKKQRREALKGIMRDQIKRQRLIVHSKALIERKKNLQNRLLEDEDFTPLLEAFPCWAVTTYAVSESLPLKPGLFDVAIIDEASQCDIASCFPILYRAKRAVIVGDDKQLPHLSFLEKAKEQSFLSQYNIPDKYQLMWRFRTNSMFDIANYYSANPVLLDEHFRSRPPIIKFSNSEFYGDRIRIMNKEIDPPNSLTLTVVRDGKTDLDVTRNPAEVEKIMEKVHEIINSEADNKLDKPTTIGIISPFRGQVELIKKAISQVLSESIINRHQIEVGTAHTFQGDEKDVILLSFVLAQNSHIQSLTFVQKPNLFNVAITRAKKELHCYLSRDIESLPNGILRSYLEYIRELAISAPKDIFEQEQFYKNDVEKEIAEQCKQAGLKVLSNFSSAGYLIDLVVTDGIRQIAVECDGIIDKNSKPLRQIKKHAILERCGWNVLRITAREWYGFPKVCLDRILNNFKYNNF